MGDDNKGPIDRVLDLFVYAPIGFVMNLDEVVPQLIEKGHQQVEMARVFGKFAVEAAETEVPKRLAELQERLVPRRPQASSSSSPTTPPPARSVPADNGQVAPADAVDAPPASELSIPDYDALSASQVVPRLDGLSSDELDAVRRYEATHRGRKTILSKITQLQG